MNSRQGCLHAMTSQAFSLLATIYTQNLLNSFTRHLPLPGPLHLTLPKIPRPLLLQKLLLLLTIQPLELRIPLDLLLLLQLQASLLRLLIRVNLLDLLSLFIPRRTNTAQHFGAEVGGAGKRVGKAQEGGEEGDGFAPGPRGGGRGELEGEGDALFGGEFVEARRVVSGVSSVCEQGWGCQRYIRYWLVDGLVGDDQRLESFARLGNSFDQRGCKKRIRDLRAFTHNRGPVGQLGTVFCVRQR